MAAAGTLAAGTGVLTAALLVPAAASASSSQTWTRSGMFGTLTGTPAYTVNYTATAANVVYP
jgi:hypothetical protein